jgi:hypothetical protein
MNVNVVGKVKINGKKQKTIPYETPTGSAFIFPGDDRIAASRMRASIQIIEKLSVRTFAYKKSLLSPLLSNVLEAWIFRAQTKT